MPMYQWFAEVHHWTPEQVDRLTLDQLAWFPLMKEALGNATDQHREKEE